MFCCCDNGYIESQPAMLAVGLPSVASMTKFFWQERTIGDVPRAPEKYCCAVARLPASGVNTALFLRSGPYGVSLASSACSLVICAATLESAIGSTTLPYPLTSE